MSTHKAELAIDDSVGELINLADLWDTCGNDLIKLAHPDLGGSAEMLIFIKAVKDIMKPKVCQLRNMENMNNVADAKAKWYTDTKQTFRKIPGSFANDGEEK